MTRAPSLPVALLLAALAACTSGGKKGPANTMPTLASHAKYFPIGPGDAHGPAPGTSTVDCNACHYDAATGNPTTAFTTYTCTGCHAASAAATGPHSGSALPALVLAHGTAPMKAKVDALAASLGTTFAADDASCRRCHPQGIAIVDHGPIFPLPHQDKAGTVVARCADCHVQPGDRTVLGCASCHPHDQAPTDTLHASVPDFAELKAAGTASQLSSACVRCHPNGVTQVAVADHPAAANGFGIEGSRRHTGPLGGKCLSCHQALSSDPNKPLAADFKVSTCVGCHTAGGADVPVGGGSTAATHSDQASLQVLHDAMALVPDPTPGAPAGTPLFPKAATFAATVTAQGSLSAACLVCHPTGDGLHPFFPRPHHTKATTPDGDCADCHTDPPARLSTALACAACHASSAPVTTHHAGKVVDVSPTDASAAASALCVRCHDNDATSVRVATHLPFDIATSKHAASNGQRCLDCHQATKGEPTPWAADFKVTGCVGCHVPVAGGAAQHDSWASLAAIHGGLQNYPTSQPTDAAFSAACLACHPSGAAGPPADHGDFFSLATTGKHPYPSARIGKCLDCHTSANRKAPTDFACATCHARDTTPLATGHASVPDQLADPANPVKCLACHANGVLPMNRAGATVTVAGHAAAASGFSLTTGKHVGALGGRCLSCHPGLRPPSTSTSPPPHWDYATDFTATACVGCHDTTGADVLVGSTTRVSHNDATALAALPEHGATFLAKVTSAGSLSAACLLCHPQGAHGHPPNGFPIGQASQHAGQACNDCHTKGTDAVNAKDLTALACVTCHAGLPATATRKAWSTAHAISGYGITTYLTATTAGGTTSTVAIDMTRPASCLRCHADSQVDRVAAHVGGDSGFGTGRHKPAGCLTCHSMLRTDKAWPAADFKEARGAAGPPPSGCYVCHRSGSG